MNMATRCIVCGTIFRVVQDQLKVSEGWVRCGRCDEVFNALEGLFDLDREAPPPWHPGMTPSAERDTAFEKTAADLAEEDRIASRFFRPEPDEPDQAPAGTVTPGHHADFADAQFDADLLTEEEAGLPPATDPAVALSRGRNPGAPAFVRAAERAARWRTPRARAWLASTGLLLLVLLLLQMGHHFRDLAAARWPAWRPVLGAWCSVAGCRLEPPRRIEDVTVESSSLTRAAGGSDTFKLAVTLRNRGTLAVGMPSIDLTLTDTAGQLVARRALGPADFGAPGPTLAAGAEVPLQLLLSAGSPRVSGYTVEIFYP
jgi:predicted Zn finger-like uncharacterized protein